MRGNFGSVLRRAAVAAGASAALIAAAAAPGAAAPATTVTAAKTCKVDAQLVPTCGVLWGAAAGGFTSTPRDQALYQWEKTSGRPTSIYHTYHSGDQLFPT